MYRVICFSEKEPIEEEGRVGRTRRDRGDEGGMKREGDTGENSLHLALQLIPADETKSEMW